MKNAVVIDPVEVDRGYGNLANAIVLQAVADYRRLLRGKRIRNGDNHCITLKECEDFFLSEWFYTLTSVDGQTILNRLRREYYNECKTNSANSQPH